jgi:hypothetical protein
MKPTLFLRIASGLTLLHCVLHTMGGVLGSPQHGAEEVAVIATMKAHSFDFFGSMRSYWDFFFGYGLFITIALLIQGLLFWQLGTMAKVNAAWTRPIVALFFFNYAAMAIVSWRYFFVLPAVNELLIAACLAVAFAKAAGNVPAS